MATADGIAEIIRQIEIIDTLLKLVLVDERVGVARTRCDFRVHQSHAPGVEILSACYIQTYKIGIFGFSRIYDIDFDSGFAIQVDVTAVC